MTARWSTPHQSHDAYKRLTETAAALASGPLDVKLRDLVNIRASQINGCAFCVDMHVKEARIHGERDLRVHHVAVWRESPLFSARERAAFAWTEALTRLGVDPVPDELYEEVRGHFSEREVSDLTFAIGMINLWNRLSIGSRAVPGSADKAFGLEKADL